jgi:hypothetical protein
MLFCNLAKIVKKILILVCSSSYLANFLDFEFLNFFAPLENWAYFVDFVYNAPNQTRYIQTHNVTFLNFDALGEIS